MPIDVLSLERICSDGWPGTCSRTDGDWITRYGNGFTSRANSVLVLGSPDAELPDALRGVTDWYARFGAVPKFQIPTGPGLPDAVAGIDGWLQRGGWTVGDRVSVQTAAIADVLTRCPDRPDLRLSPADSPGAGWLSGYHYRGRPLGPDAVPVLTAGPAPVFLSVHRGDDQVGVGRGVVTQGWLGITAVTVAASARRSGVGTAVMAGLLSWGRDRGAHSVYLQVDRANPVALAMYARLGFTEHHGYHYLLPPEPSAS